MTRSSLRVVRIPLDIGLDIVTARGDAIESKGTVAGAHTRDGLAFFVEEIDDTINADALRVEQDAGDSCS